MKTEAYKLEYSEYFCQMSSKSILAVLRYTTGSAFLRHSVLCESYTKYKRNEKIQITHYI